MTKVKYIMILFLIPAIVLGLYGFYLWNQPHRSIRNAPAVEIAAKKLFQDYESNEEQTNIQYIDKILQVSGQVRHVRNNKDGETVITLEAGHPIFGINCTFEEENIRLKAGDEVMIKGLCTGYLTDVVLIRCYLIK